MTRNDMQRFLDRPEIMSLGELEALRKLVQVIGIQYHGEQDRDGEKPDNRGE